MDSKTFGTLCWKYSNHPLNVRFRSAQIAFILLPLVLLGLATYRVFEFIQAFLTWPFLSPFKMIAQEVEPSCLAGVYDPCFDQVQFQSVLLPIGELALRPFGLLPGCAQHDEVIGIAHHFKVLSGHLPVQSVQVDI